MGLNTFQNFQNSLRSSHHPFYNISIGSPSVTALTLKFFSPSKLFTTLLPHIPLISFTSTLPPVLSDNLLRSISLFPLSVCPPLVPEPSAAGIPSPLILETVPLSTFSNHA
ncbi:hypothetical protein GJAV_G00264240 [Gymnothorax javanicus]|nr:hypothetical protein GJAV_G00264240 [Gymnothorax javanicus]